MHMSEKSNGRPTTITGVLTILRAKPVSKNIVATILLNCGWNDGDLMMMTVAVRMKWDTMMAVAVKKKNLIQLLKLIISMQWSFIRKLTYSLWSFYIFHIHLFTIYGSNKNLQLTSYEWLESSVGKGAAPVSQSRLWVWILFKICFFVLSRR